MRASSDRNAVGPPLTLVAELTHRCPLGCPYCWNPLALEPPEQELDAATWARVFAEAAAIGMRQVQLSGGEPGARRDLVDIAAHAREAGLHTILVTSGVGIATRTLRDLWEAGLDHIQVSFQDADAVPADRVAGYRGAFQRKHALAAETVRLGLPLSISFVVHRANIERIGAMVELALELHAGRIELLPVRFVGWARKNRGALEPTAGQVEWASARLGELRVRHRGRIVIDAAPWNDAGPLRLLVTPSGQVSPWPSRTTAAPPEHWNIHSRSLADICASSHTFNGSHRAEAPPVPAEALADAGARPYVYRTRSGH